MGCAPELGVVEGLLSKGEIRNLDILKRRQVVVVCSLFLPRVHIERSQTLSLYSLEWGLLDASFLAWSGATLINNLDTKTSTI